ncbi:hypothetical protein [Acidihalobacter ferrooxydans]|uniref:Heme-copper oxidase subunit III family profile domain-containing protein n=1 Tax=Acidihalobacter ferrooxydans TaxID=1765967 RepID=A0A1P8UDL2_9GAMM|nr:hypothetical protein [Acidihalobacter ferrooxydans]APZ41942.1 hypothetical protein BW247_01550 [Acidihalobacter ferrooxydans]
MDKEERLGPVGSLGNGYRQETPYYIDDATPRTKRSAFFTITLASVMWWVPLLWARFLYAPGVGPHKINLFAWTVAMVLVLASGAQAYRLLRALRAGEYKELYPKLVSMVVLGLLVCASIFWGWASSSVSIATPYGSIYYFFSTALGVFFLVSIFTETLHAMRAGSRWGAGYDVTSGWRVENSAYVWLWNCLWFLVFYVIFFWV